jgi:hypothetical protein
MIPSAGNEPAAPLDAEKLVAGRMIPGAGSAATVHRSRLPKAAAF